MGYKFDWGKKAEEIKTNDAKKTYEKDARFWKPTVDDKGNATAIIRFLPDTDGNPFAKYYTHNFNYMLDGTKKFWIRNCINTFGYDRECPICKKNQEYWASSFESDKKIASARKRKLIFVSNILVIKNPANPEDEGKVFLFQYGQKIYEKIKDKWFPSDEVKALGEGSYDEYCPFDLYDGANFKLVVSKQGDYPNYDKSEFSSPKALGTDKQIDAIMGKTYKVDEFMAEDKFPTNEEVVKTLGKILGVAVSKPEDDVADDATGDDDIFGKDDVADNSASDTSNFEDNSTTDEDADFFKQLREDD